MNKIIRIVTILVIGLISYEAYQFLFGGGFKLPLSATQAAEIVFFIAVAIAGNFVHGLVDNTSSREQGSVKWFNSRKGYGFITRDQGDDIFVHFRNIKGSGRKTLREGDRVSFAVILSDKGPQADKVKIA